MQSSESDQGFSFSSLGEKKTENLKDAELIDKTRCLIKRDQCLLAYSGSKVSCDYHPAWIQVLFLTALLFIQG